MPTTTPDDDQLAAALCWTTSTLGPVLAALEHSDALETWDNPDRPGRRCVMLSATSVARLGLRLARGGKRWIALGEAIPPPTAPTLPANVRPAPTPRGYRRFSAASPGESKSRRRRAAVAAPPVAQPPR
jgi:hypothetical protein